MSSRRSNKGRESVAELRQLILVANTWIGYHQKFAEVAELKKKSESSIKYWEEQLSEAGKQLRRLEGKKHESD